MLVSFFLRGNIKLYLKIYIGKTTLNTGFAGDWLKGEVTDWRSRKNVLLCSVGLSLALTFPCLVGMPWTVKFPSSLRLGFIICK